MLLIALACTPMDADSGPAAEHDSDAADTAAVETIEPADAATGSFAATNSADRNGAWYLPAGWNVEPVPVLVLYHGTGGDGAGILFQFTPWAEAAGLALVAPDSRVSPSGQVTWEVGTEPGEITEDVEHTAACLDELAATEGLTLSEGDWWAAGFSGGGSSAPYYATNDERFLAYASLHGGAFPGGMGENLAQGWFSTGEDDSARPPEMVEADAQAVADAGYPEPELRVYAGGHTLSETELDELVAWWAALAGP